MRSSRTQFPRMLVAAAVFPLLATGALLASSSIQLLDSTCWIELEPIPFPR